jgi:hypothetical protein
MKRIIILSLVFTLFSCDKKCEYTEVETFPFPCEKGMDVVFALDYTRGMNTTIDSFKTAITGIVNLIQVFSNNNYQIGLTLFDEGEKSVGPNYAGSPFAPKIID